MGFAHSYAELHALQKSSRGVSLYTLLVNRPWGRVLAAGAHAVGLTADHVSLLSALATLVGLSVLVAAPTASWVGVVVACLLALGFALDSADGQLARLRARTSLSGEWLDHLIDSGKMVTVHSAVLVAWVVGNGPDGAWLLAPLAFQLVSVMTFAGLTLVGLLRRVSGARREAPPAHSTLRRVLLLPVDFGVLCWIFVLWSATTLFAWVYVLLLTINAAALVYFVLKWHAELASLDRPADSATRGAGDP